MPTLAELLLQNLGVGSSVATPPFVPPSSLPSGPPTGGPPVGGVGPPVSRAGSPIRGVAPPTGFGGRLQQAFQSPMGQFGLNLLANSGPSVVPRSTGSLIGQAGLAANQSVQQQQLLDLQKRLIEAQITAGGSFTARNVQSTFKGENGNMHIVTRDGRVKDTGIGFRENLQLVEQSDGSVVAVDRATGQRVGTPVTADEAAMSTERAAATERRAEAQGALPRVQEQARRNLEILDRLENHPGFSGAVGAQGISTGFGLAEGAIPGTDEADFIALVDQIGGAAFLEAFQGLKGGGQITEVEGLKAEQAITTLRNRGQSEESYRQAIKDLRDVINSGLSREREAAGESTGESRVIEFSDLPEG